MVVRTFVEQHDFIGKTILPFCTNEGSGMGHSTQDLKQSCPTAKICSGLPLTGHLVEKSEDQIRNWLQEYSLLRQR